MAVYRLLGIVEDRLRIDFSIDGGFLRNDGDSCLLSSFATFYAARIAMFGRSTHILDAEDAVQERLSAMQLTKDGSPATHFRFADSTTEPGIQLAERSKGGRTAIVKPH